MLTVGQNADALYGWAESAVGGHLDQRLQKWRNDGLSLDRIVDIFRELKVNVSRETVRRWLQDGST